MNHIVAIGWYSEYTIYVNVPREEAIKRWKQENADYLAKYVDDEGTWFFTHTKEFDFEDKFFAYDVGKD